MYAVSSELFRDGSLNIGELLKKYSVSYFEVSEDNVQ
jgi:hypothetical protein